MPSIRLNPLRYPGGKRWFAPFLEQLTSNNFIRPNLFVEPFAGGAAVSLHLLQTNKVEAIGLADKDPLLSSFWKTVFYDTDWLLDRIENADVTIEEWLHWKHTNYGSTRERAYQCLFLNRTSFSGIMEKRAGPIGGLLQKSVYKIDCRFNKDVLVKTIRYLSDEFSDRVLFVWNKSWKYTLNILSRRVSNESYDKSKLLIYLDPPFIQQGRNLYRHSFEQYHHIELRDALADCTLNWILSYDDCEMSRRLYKGLPKSSLDVLYCASKGKTQTKAKSELIVSNLENTLSAILPTNKKRRRITANTIHGKRIRIKEEALCQSHTKASSTRIR